MGLRRKPDQDRGELIYLNFTEAPQAQPMYWWDDLASSKKPYMDIMESFMYLTMAPGLLLFFLFTPMEWFFTIAFIPLTILAYILSIIQFHNLVAKRYWHQLPSVYENGISWYPKSHRYGIYKVEFTPFSEIERALTEISDDFLLKETVWITEKETRSIVKDVISRGKDMKQIIKENPRWKSDRVMFVFTDGEKKWFWREDIKDVYKLKDVLRKRGVVVA